MAKILMICDVEPAPVIEGVKKLRAVMLAERLVAQNHEVTFIRTTFDHDKKSHYFTDHATQEVAGVRYIFAL